TYFFKSVISDHRMKLLTLFLLLVYLLTVSAQWFEPFRHHHHHHHFPERFGRGFDPFDPFFDGGFGWGKK
ncbi:hypothetical protein V3C99_016065, partial [Haemonchus contortus]